MSDWELLSQFVTDRSEDAFARLVERHAGMVYAVCRRRLHDAHLAEDATQAVFMVLAARAKSLKAGTLAGWLHQTARNVADRTARHEETRKRHEQKAAAEKESIAPPTTPGQDTGDLVDGMLTRLPDRDRSAIVLRYLEGRSMSEIATAMQLTEDAAKKRVTRGLERLRKLAVMGAAPATVTAVETALASAAGPQLPELVAKAVDAAMGKTKGIQTTLVAKEVIRMIAFKQIQTVALTGMAIVAVTAGTTVLLTRTGDRSAANAAPVAQTPATPAAAQTRRPIDPKAAIVRRLPQLQFEGVALSDVMDFLKDVSGVPMDVDWDALQQAGVGKNTVVTANLRNGSLAACLDLILWSAAEPGKLDYALREDRIVISTAAALNLPKGDEQARADETVVQRLGEKKIEDLKADKFQDVMAYVAKLTSIPVWVDWVSLKHHDVTPDARVEAKQLSGMTVPAAIEKTLSQAAPNAKLNWIFRDGMIIVSTETELGKLKALPYVKHAP